MRIYNINYFSLFLNLERLKLRQCLFVLLGLLDDIQTIVCRFYLLLMLLRFEILNIKVLKLLKRRFIFKIENTVSFKISFNAL